MDIVRLFQDYDIEYQTEGHKHCRSGWVNTECPFCTGNAGLHLGYNLKDDYWQCWRCGWHPPIKTVSTLLQLSYTKTVEIVKQYGINASFINETETTKIQFKFPSRTIKLKDSHRQYLKDRNFNPDKIEKLWGIKSTSPISTLKGISYKFRIIIPYYWNSQVVSFDARDVTDRQFSKYQACPKEYETVEHKKILYGLQEKWDTNIGICVEGTTDVWRLGKLAFATSGIKFTPAQVRLMANTFKNVAVVFDDEPQAIIQADKLIKELQFRGVNAWRETIIGDPAALSDIEAKKLVKRIVNKVK